MALQILIAFIFYFCFLTSIGLYFYQTTKTADAFIIGDRSVNYWVTAIATQASDMGSWLFLGLPAAVYAHGLFELWTPIGLLCGMWLCWHFIAPRLRTETEKYGSKTLSSFFSQRFNDTSGIITLLSACMALIFFMFYIASSLVGLGRLFESAFQVSYQTGTVLGLLSALLYTLLGGFVAVAWCDLFQGMFLLCMIVVVPTYALITLGGVSTVISTIQFHNVPLSLASSWSDFFNGLLLAAGWGLGYFGQPHVLTNFMGIDDVRNIRAAKYIGLIWQTIVLCAAVGIGLIGFAYFNGAAEDSQQLFITMAHQLFPQLLTGFVLCGILAATLSTLDSHILISGSVLAEDIYKKLFHIHASSNTIMWISRAGTIIVSLIGLYVAQYNTVSIYSLVNYAWAGLGSSFGPLVIMSLYGGKNVTRQGAIAGIITGGSISALWPYINITILPLVPGFFSGLCAIICVSYFTKK